MMHPQGAPVGARDDGDERATPRAALTTPSPSGAIKRLRPTRADNSSRPVIFC